MAAAMAPNPFNALGDPTFSYVTNGALRLSAAMQPTSLTVPNWGNMRCVG